MIKFYVNLVRFNRPIPIFMILWPTMWAVFSASNKEPSLKIITIFTLGSIILRTAGCIINDIIDRNIDYKIERTKNRVITRGIISARKAFYIFIFLLVCSFMLVLTLNILTIILSFLALFLIILYPFCKRFFILPQLILGLTFNFGIIMAYAAIQGAITFSALIIYTAAVFWTMSYDTIYAMADRSEDIAINIKSSAITFGRAVNFFIILFQLLMLMFLSFFGLINGYKINYYIIVFTCVFLFYSQYKIYKIGKDHNRYIQAFSDNHWVGLFVFFAILHH